MNRQTSNEQTNRIQLKKRGRGFWLAGYPCGDTNRRSSKSLTHFHYSRTLDDLEQGLLRATSGPITFSRRLIPSTWPRCRHRASRSSRIFRCAESCHPAQYKRSNGVDSSDWHRQPRRLRRLFGPDRSGWDNPIPGSWRTSYWFRRHHNWRQSTPR